MGVSLLDNAVAGVTPVLHCKWSLAAEEGCMQGIAIELWSHMLTRNAWFLVNEVHPALQL